MSQFPALIIITNVTCISYSNRFATNKTSTSFIQLVWSVCLLCVYSRLHLFTCMDTVCLFILLLCSFGRYISAVLATIFQFYFSAFEFCFMRTDLQWTWNIILGGIDVYFAYSRFIFNPDECKRSASAMLHLAKCIPTFSKRLTSMRPLFSA